MKTLMLILIMIPLGVIIGVIFGLLGVWFLKIIERIKDKKNIRNLREGKIKNQYFLDGKMRDVNAFVIPKEQDSEENLLISLKGGVSKQEYVSEGKPKDTKTSEKARVPNKSILKRR